nr:reverse transcriptase domain-containing protein [Tanacetum cinerariifolium]
MADCLALADLGASINLMPLSVWNKLSLPDLSPTYFDADPRVPLIFGRSFLKTERALIDLFKCEPTLHVGKEAITFNLDHTSRYPANYNEMMANRIYVINMDCEVYLQEVLGFSNMITSGNPTPYYDPIVSTTSLTLTLFENSDFLLEEVDAFLDIKDDPTLPKVDQSYVDTEGDILLLEAFLNDDPSLPPPNQGNYLPEVRKELEICKAKSDKSLIDEPPEVELKDLPPHLEYVFLEGDDKLPVIFAKDLSVEEKTALMTVLMSHKRAIAWKLSDIKRIDPEFYTLKILMEEDFEPAVQHQRRVNPKIHDVIKQEVLKLLDAGLIYPLSDSPWVSPVHCVPKRVVLQLYFQIPIDPKDQEKTTFTCPYRTFAYRRMPFGLCNAPGTFQRCMMAIFYDMIEKTMEVFIDDFSVFGNSFQTCLSYLEKMLKRCEDTNLCLNREKSHFMVKEGIVLCHKISKEGIEVDKSKFDVITKLPHQTTVKGIRSFLGHVGFYRRFIKDFSKIARPVTRLLEKDTQFLLSKECVEAFQTLQRKLTEASILIDPDWDMPFELMCDASDFAISAVLGQSQEKHFRPIHCARAENLAADHLSQLENPHQNVLDPKEINEPFPLETLNLFSTRGNSTTPWFADFANYHARNFVVKGVYMARKPLTFSRLATKDPPSDTMAQITQRRRGNKYILSDIDYLSKWVEAKALPTNDARVVYKFLKNLFARFGTPRAIISDRGTHFCNDQFAKVMQTFGVTHRLATPYHPQTSGQVEIFFGKLKSHWSGPFTISHIFPYGTVDLSQPDGPNFKVNGHRLKHYFGEDVPDMVVPDLQTFPKDH